MIKILFFAQIREAVGVSELNLTIANLSVAELLQRLSMQGERWHYALLAKRVLCAVNQEIVSFDQQLCSGDEIAFFPPVTGG